VTLVDVFRTERRPLSELNLAVKKQLVGIPLLERGGIGYTTDADVDGSDGGSFSGTGC
jgi:hypothetical protein